MHEKIHGFIAINNPADDEGYNGSEGVIHQKPQMWSDSWKPNSIRDTLDVKLKINNSGMRSEVAFEIKACHGNCNLEIEENP